MLLWCNPSTAYHKSHVSNCHVCLSNKTPVKIFEYWDEYLDHENNDNDDKIPFDKSLTNYNLQCTKLHCTEVPKFPAPMHPLPG